MHGTEHAEFGRLRPAPGSQTRDHRHPPPSGQPAARKPERDREAFERILSSGPLFKPERLPVSKISSHQSNRTASAPSIEVSPPRDTRFQPGWIYVVSSEAGGDVLRLAATERAQPKRRDIDAIELFERDLGLHDEETLRYCAFTSNAYLALTHARAALQPYEVSELRYACPSAVAATAIETSRAPIQMRRTNFESDASADPVSSGDQNSLRATPSDLLSVAANLAAKKMNRDARREELIEFLSSAQSCLNHASDALGDSQQTREAITGTLFADVSGLTPAMNLQRWQTASSPDNDQQKRDTKPPRPSRRNLKKMEHWVLRREALQFLKSRNIELATGLLVAFVAGALLTTVSVKLAFEAFGSAQPDTGVILMAAIAGAILPGAIRAALFWRRHKRAIGVWKEVLQVSAPGTR